jgi:hypothetical protein
MVDTPEDDKIPDGLSFLQNYPDVVSPIVRAAAGYASGQGSAMAVSSFVYAPPSDGYVPDPHDDPKKLLELINSSAPAMATGLWPSDQPQQIDMIYRLAGELGSKMSEIELGWYLVLISLMPQTPRPIIDAVINPRKSTNGGQQRGIILEIARSIFPDDKSDFRLFLKELKTATDTLQGRRNAAIHSIIKIGLHQGYSRIVVTGTTQPSKLPDLTPSKIKDELKSCIDEADRIIEAIKKYFQHVSTRELSTPDLVFPQLDNEWSPPL